MLGVSGEQTITAGSANTTFSIRCEGAGAASQASASVEILPTGDGTMVSLGSGVSAAAKQAIVSVTSTVDESKLEAAVRTREISADGGNLILSLNASNEIMLAAFALNGSTQMTSASTALALVRIGFGGWDPQAVTAQRLNTVIEASAALPALVAAIDAALAVGSSPVNSADVLTQTQAVLADVIQALRAPTAPSSNDAGAKRSANLAQAKLTRQIRPTQLPTIMWGGTYTGTNHFDFVAVVADSLYVRGTTQSGVRVLNKSALTWEISTRTSSDGTQVIVQKLVPGVPALGWQYLAQGLVPSWAVTPEEFEGTAPVYFLRARQTSTTRQENIARVSVDVLNSILQLGLGVKVPEACATTVIQDLLNAPILEMVAQLNASSTLSADEVRERFAAMLRSKVLAYSNVLVECVAEKATKEQFFFQLLNWVNKVNQGIDVLNATNALGQLLVGYSDDVEMELCQVGTVLRSCDPKLAVTSDMPPGWNDAPYGMWSYLWFGREGPQCTEGRITRHTEITNSNGTKTTSDGVSEWVGCTDPNELNAWRLREDGQYWNLILSGGIGAGGSMRHEGRVTLSFRNTANPAYRNVEHDYSCEVAQTWQCTVTPVTPPPSSP